jgi:hypothetical protein
MIRFIAYGLFTGIKPLVRICRMKEKGNPRKLLFEVGRFFVRRRESGPEERLLAAGTKARLPEGQSKGLEGDPQIGF